MAALGGILFVIGMIVAVVGGLWLLVVSFQESVWWGLGNIFIPFCALVFVIMFWKKGAAKPFLITLGGSAIYIIGAVLTAVGAGGEGIMVE